MALLTRILILSSIILNICCTRIDQIDFDPSPSFANCTCVPYFQCSEETGKIITDGTGLFDVRDFNKSDICTGYFDVCCDSSAIQASTEIDFPSGTTVLNNLEDKLQEAYGVGCGYQYPDTFPWAGALLNQDTSLGQVRYKCGVSVIHPQVVLTAAHCLEIEEQSEPHWMIRVGHMSREVKQIVVHPEYNDRSLHNDLALIILSSAVQLSSKVNPICIPSMGVRLDGIRCAVSVWAKDTTYLKMVDVPVVGRERCLNILRQTRLGGFFQLHKSFICAGGTNNNQTNISFSALGTWIWFLGEDSRDTCGGDGGSPLICPVANQPGRYQQAGIVSWGIGCGEDNVPGVYVYLPVFRDWIDQVLLINGFEINDYRY